MRIEFVLCAELHQRPITTCLEMLRKIISEGQTGADRAGLDFAIEKGLEHGGYVPKGLMTQDFVEYSPAIRPNKHHPRTRSYLRSRQIALKKL